MQVSVNRLMAAIKEADTFRLPSMNAGTEYLYNRIYRRLSQNVDVRLSEIDFDAFDPDDITTLNYLHDDVFDKNNCAADGIMNTLRETTPMHRAVAYV